MTPGAATHRYAARLAWCGSTAAGYDNYPRAHEATCPPATDGLPLPLSSDPTFGGDPDKLNPEQLLVLAAPEDERPMRITRIVLRPQITVASDAPDDARLEQLAETAHRHCFIANSLTTETVLEPIFHRTPR